MTSVDAASQRDRHRCRREELRERRSATGADRLREQVDRRCRPRAPRRARSFRTPARRAAGASRRSGASSASPGPGGAVARAAADARQQPDADRDQRRAATSARTPPRESARSVTQAIATYQSRSPAARELAARSSSHQVGEHALERLVGRPDLEQGDARVPRRHRGSSRMNAGVVGRRGPTACRRPARRRRPPARPTRAAGQPAVVGRAHRERSEGGPSSAAGSAEVARSGQAAGVRRRGPARRAARPPRGCGS